MSRAIPTTEPEKIVAGNTLKFTRDIADFPRVDGWILKYALRGPKKIDITATDSAGLQLVEVAASATKLWIPGVYQWQSWVELGTEKYDIARGFLEVVANMALVADEVHDGRTPAKKTRDALEAAIYSRASQPELELEIGGKKIRLMTLEEQTKAFQFFDGQWKKEQEAALVSAGKQRKTKILLNFSRR